LFLNHLQNVLRIRGIVSVTMHEPLSNIRPIIFLRFAEGAPRAEVWRGLRGAATLQAQCGKLVIAVSEDIDPTNTDAVMWSLAYRMNPVEDLELMPHRSRGHGPKSGGGDESGLLIDATKKHDMPPLALPKQEYMERARQIWEELNLPRLSPQPPWHGYSLGDWNGAWDVFAQKAVSGEWAENGKATYERRRSGMKPETPTRQVEGQPTDSAKPKAGAKARE
jgi:hypothetical protein